MTILFADSVDRQENSDVIRWAVSLLLVLVFHFVVALWLFSREPKVEPHKPPPPAALLDLPPLSNGPKPPAPILPTKPAPVPTVPAKPPAQQTTPPKPPEKDIKPAVPPALPLPKFAVPLPVPTPAPVKPVPPRPRPPKAAPEPAAPPPGSGTPVYLDPMRVWQIAAKQRLEKFRMQSRGATWRGEEGTVGLLITIDHRGNILTAQVAQSSGYNTLDNQAMTMCRLAQPLPPLPAELKQDRYTFGISIEFTLY
jgi:protein TonB